jgi:uncharacterized membrane protein YhaH (DUF805 family)
MAMRASQQKRWLIIECGGKMSDDLHNQIYRSLNQKETDELIEIWKTNDRTAWTETAFDEIRRILEERLVELPSQEEPVSKTNGIRDVEPSEITNMTLAQIYFSFNGRIGLATYWIKGFLPILGLTVIAGIVEGSVSTYSGYSGIPTIIGRLLIIWPALAITVKRWHDRDKSGLWILIGLIPIVGQIWAFIENGFLSGTKGPNQYGSKSF